jgi:cell division protein FtsQ
LPLDRPDADGNDASNSVWVPSGGGGFDGTRRDWPGNPWWRPSSVWGRAFLGLGALIVLGGLATGAFFLKTYLERDARFRIAGTGNIEATGLTEVSRAEMLPVFGEDIGRNIFFVSLSERRRQLEEIPWVERATVMRVLPDRIRVHVVERQPVAFVRQGQQIGLVDANGVLLAMPAVMMAQRHYSFPVLTGINPRDSLEARKGRMAVYGRLLAELDANNQHLSEQISEIDLTDPEDARVLMPEQGEDILAHFGEDRFLERYQRYKAHIAEWRQQYPKLAAVDLRYDQQVVLEMTPGANGDQATVGGENALGGSEEKPSAAAPAEKDKPNPAQAANNPSGKAAGKPIAEDKTGKPAVRRGELAATATSRPKSAAVKDRAAQNKAAQDNKKRTEAKRTSLGVNRRKPAPKTRPVVVARRGE